MEFAARHRLPTMYDDADAVEAGGLMSYWTERGRRPPARRDVTWTRSSRGRSPATLPIEQPTKFDLFVNLKTATALGLTIAPSILARADQIIK